MNLSSQIFLLFCSCVWDVLCFLAENIWSRWPSSQKATSFSNYIFLQFHFLWPGHFWKTKHPLNILSSELTMNSKLKTKVWKIRAEVLLWNYQPWLSIGQGLILQMSLNLEFWAIGILASNQNYPVLILEIFWVLFFCCCCWWYLLCLFWGCQEVNTMLKETSEIPQSLRPESLWLLYCTQLFSDVSYITWLPHTKLWRNSGISAEFCTPKEWKGLLTFCLQMQASRKLKTFFWSHIVPRNQHCPLGAKNDQ